MQDLNDKLLEFIDKTPNAYCCVENIKKILIENGFEELYEEYTWDNLKVDGKYFVSRNDSSLIAFKMSNKNLETGFNITAVHDDSPSFQIKPNPEMFDNGYLKLNISGYGGMLNYSWLDRPLSLAGRVIVLDKGIYKSYIVNIDKDLLIIPSQAIHINREVNSKNELNHQIDMLPIMSLSSNLKLEDIIKSALTETGKSFDKICDYDLYLYNRDNSRKIGLNEEFISAPRLDDLANLLAALYSFINAKNNNSFNIFCTFNNEETGSLTKQCADSTFLIDTLTRIAKAADIDLLPALNNSIVVSADSAHALHPNASWKNDPTNKVYLNKGIVIKHHINYTTDALTSSLFKGICENADVPYQDYACRSDMKCGSTIGGISQRHVAVDSLDIGLPQLAMHSANELIGSEDTLYMYKALSEFYQTTFIKEKNMVKIRKNL
ncbi:MAG: M18 family aminopeptidase [Bacilli bacterium]